MKFFFFINYTHTSWTKTLDEILAVLHIIFRFDKLPVDNQPMWMECKRVFPDKPGKLNAKYYFSSNFLFI